MMPYIYIEIIILYLYQLPGYDLLTRELIDPYLHPGQR